MHKFVFPSSFRRVDKKQKGVRQQTPLHRVGRREQTTARRCSNLRGWLLRNIYGLQVRNGVCRTSPISFFCGNKNGKRRVEHINMLRFMCSTWPPSHDSVTLKREQQGGGAAHNWTLFPQPVASQICVFKMQMRPVKGVGVEGVGVLPECCRATQRATHVRFTNGPAFCGGPTCMSVECGRSQSTCREPRLGTWRAAHSDPGPPCCGWDAHCTTDAPPSHHKIRNSNQKISKSRMLE